VCGNSPLDQVVINTAKVLELCGRKVPIYKGCSSPLNEPLLQGVHGKDGMGDTEIVKTIKGYTECIDHKEHGSVAIVRLANEFPGDLNLICIGPLTNIAVALKLDPELATKVKSITIMGGTSRGAGNVTLSTECNFR